MAKREISIRLSAKNAMAAGIAKASAQLKAFGKSAGRIGKTIAIGFTVATAAVVAFGVQMVKAYGVQQAAEKSLTDALKARGLAGEKLLPILKAQAAAIQDETGAADENTLATMAQLSTLGVATSKLGEAAKATIALKSVGLQGASAQRAVAMAMQGNFEMLNRYVPALRAATDETEKARVVNDLFRQGYEQQKGQLDTLPGAWKELTGRIGDLKEEVGKAIAENAGIANALSNAADKVKEFGEAVAKWVGGEGIVNAFATLEMTIENIRFKLKILGNTAATVFAAIADGAETAWNRINKAGTSGGRHLKTVWGTLVPVSKSYWNLIKHPSIEAWKEMGSAALSGTKDTAKSYKTLAKDIAGQTKEIMDGKGVISSRTEAVLSAVQQIEKEHADRVAEIGEKHTKRLIELSNKRKESAVDDIEEVTAAQEAAAKKRSDLSKKLADSVKREDELMMDAEKAMAKERADALKDRLQGLQDQKAAVQELAKKTIEGFLAEARAKKDLEKQAMKDQKRATELEGRLGRGVGLGKENQAWLDAFNAIKNAKEEVGPGGPLVQDIARVKNNLDQLNRDLTQREIRDLMMTEAGKQDAYRKDMATLARMG